MTDERFRGYIVSRNMLFILDSGFGVKIVP